MAEAETNKVLRIGTRKSDLAMWQALLVFRSLTDLHASAGVSFEVVGMSTLGDDVQNIPLSQFSDKGIFTKELDRALLGGAIDFAVHCVKDLPTVLPPGLQIAVMMARGDTQDALVLHAKHLAQGVTTLEGLPEGSVIGTSALRRKAMISSKHSNVSFRDIRGNVNTRLSKLDAGDYDGIILACTGLRRLGFADRIASVLSAEQYGYAVGQGALAVVCRQGDTRVIDLCRPLEDMHCTLACLAERGLLRTLEGGCKVPIAVRSDLVMADDGSFTFTLRGQVLSATGSTIVEGSMSLVEAESEGKASESHHLLACAMLAASTDDQTTPLTPSYRCVLLGCRLADSLIAKGADVILAEIRKTLEK